MPGKVIKVKMKDVASNAAVVEALRWYLIRARGNDVSLKDASPAEVLAAWEQHKTNEMTNIVEQHKRHLDEQARVEADKIEVEP